MIFKDFFNIYKISKGTFLELLKTKVVYIGFFLAIFLVFFSLIAKQLIYGVEEKLLVDFSIGLQTLFLTVLSVLFGSNVILSDMKNKYIYMLLSRPIRRYQYLLGKAFGLLGILFLLNIFLSLAGLLMYLIYDGKITQVLLNTQILMFFKSAILIMYSILFSFLFDKYLSIFFTIVVLILGYSIPNLLKTSNLPINEMTKAILKFINFFIPNFNKIDLNSLIGYVDHLKFVNLMNIYIYCLALIFGLFFFNVAIFQKKEF